MENPNCINAKQHGTKLKRKTAEKDQPQQTGMVSATLVTMSR